MCGERFDGGNHSKKATMPPVQNPSHLESCRYFTGSRLSSTFNSRCLCGFGMGLWRVYYSTAPPRKSALAVAQRRVGRLSGPLPEGTSRNAWVTSMDG